MSASAYDSPLLARLAEGLARLPDPREDPALRAELLREADRFLQRAEGLAASAARSDGGTDGNPETDQIPAAEERALRRALYDLLRDELILHMRQLLSEGYPALGVMPPPAALHTYCRNMLKELGVFVGTPHGLDLHRESLLRRWYERLLEQRPDGLSLRMTVAYFWIYRFRLYSVAESPPYFFQDLSRLVSILLEESPESLDFSDIFRAELELREIIEDRLPEAPEFAPPDRPAQTASAARDASSAQTAASRAGRAPLDLFAARRLLRRLSDEFLDALHQAFRAHFQQLLAESENQRSEALKELEEKRRQDEELASVARRHNRSLQRDLPAEDPRVDFTVWYEPFSGVGGDLYRVERLGANRYALFLADISGHGLGAAMHFHTLNNVYEELRDRADRPDRMLQKMNERLYGRLAENFVTAIAVVVDFQKRRLFYCNAAHPRGFLVFRNNPSAVKVRFLRQNARVLGAFAKGAPFRLNELPFEDGCRLALYTDGLIETMNPREDFLGERGLLDLFKGTTDKDGPETQRLVQQALAEFQGAAPVMDDRSLILADFSLPARDD